MSGERENIAPSTSKHSQEVWSTPKRPRRDVRRSRIDRIRERVSKTLLGKRPNFFAHTRSAEIITRITICNQSIALAYEFLQEIEDYLPLSILAEKLRYMKQLKKECEVLTEELKNLQEEMCK